MPRGRKEVPVVPRFWSKVNKLGPRHPVLGQCWVWTGSLTKKGYGQFWIKSSGQSERAHRVAWMFRFGDIPEHQCVLHACDNPNCVRPSHLFLGTKTENMEDRDRKGRQAKGKRQGSAKLKARFVRRIRKLSSVLTTGQLAEKYDVDWKSIDNILKGKTWGHIQ